MPLVYFRCFQFSTVLVKVRLCRNLLFLLHLLGNNTNFESGANPFCETARFEKESRESFAYAVSELPFSS